MCLSVLVVVLLSALTDVGYCASKPFAGTTLRFIGEAAALTEALEELSAEFEQETGIKVVVEQYPYDSVVQKTMLDFTAGTRVYDVVSIPYELLGRYVEKGYIQPVDKFLRNPKLTSPTFDPGDIIRPMWQGAAVWKGQCYGFPSNPCIMFMWYRKDLLEHAEEKENFKRRYGYDLCVPTTPNEYLDVAEFFTRKKGEKLAGQVLKENFYGVAIMGKRHPSLVADFLNWAWAFGGGIFDEGYDSGKVIIDSPANLEALEFYVSLFDRAIPGSVDYTWDEITTAMQQGIVFATINFNDQIPNLMDPSKSRVAGKMGYALTPYEVRPAAHYGAWTYAIPSQSKNPEAAYLFLQWAMSKDTQLKWTLMGGIPSRESTFKDRQVRSVEFMPATLDALKVSDCRPRIPEWGEMESVMQVTIHKAVTKQISPREALAHTQKEFERILGQ